jgi:hypothetical protein
MYKRILLAYDGSVEGRTALREGALAKRAQKHRSSGHLNGAFTRSRAADKARRIFREDNQDMAL